MTDKEKLDKLVAEIERLIGDYNIKTEKYRGLNEQAHQYYGGKRDALSEILKSIDSMQEEPKFKLGDIVRRKSDGLEARVINIVDGTYIVECEDWNNSILEYQWELVEEPKDCMYSKENYTDEDRKVLCEGCNEECRFNKKEEPTNENLEEFINTIKLLTSNTALLTFEYGCRKGANWQKEQMMAKAIDGEVTYGKSLAIPLLGYRLDKERLDFGDKVKVILIKRTEL